MANIVELREMSDDRLEEMLENGREELFNLRFQKASAQLDNYARLKQVRREIAQLETVLRNREQAIQSAAKAPEVAKLLAENEWIANARYVYEDKAWRVDFADIDDNELATVWVDLNKKRRKNRKLRRTKKAPQLVTDYEVAG
jgi:large subunit ribosomal protein L29